MNINELRTRLAHDEGAEMQVRGPDGVMTDFFIKFRGIDSQHWEVVKKEMGKAKEDESPHRFLAMMAVEWRGLENDGEKVPFSEESLVSLFDQAPYIFDQGNVFIADRANFLKPKPKK